VGGEVNGRLEARSRDARAMPALHPVASWGLLERPLHATVPLRDRVSIGLSRRSPDGTGLAYGNGRSYGDVCLNPGGTLWLTRGLDRFVDFDAATGVIECEAGVLLNEIIDVALPRGWFLPVTPGTQFVTLGGAIANDVHGKNHHRSGTLGEHVESLVLHRTDGTRIVCGPGAERAWFEATVAGMGLTGLIASARLRLKKVPGPWIDAETLTFDSLDRFFELSAESDAAWEYTVAWIDCVSGSGGRRRGVFFRGNHAPHGAASPRARARSVPITPPVSLVNALSLRLFNTAYYAANRAQRGRAFKHYVPFFYPLDHVLEWNRIYGPRGFYQYQSVVPREAQREATQALLQAIGNAGTGSFLGVLKTFGDRPTAGMLSFPMAGATLALDFPNLGERTQRLFTELNAIVRDAGGRLYPAKDACMPREMFERGYPRLAEFARYRDPGISSAMSRRLMGI
jgi:FAD/FMN-containing dehydrogenase